VSDIQRYKFHIPDKLACGCQYMEDDNGAYVLYEDYLKQIGELKEENKELKDALRSAIDCLEKTTINKLKMLGVIDV